MQQYSDSLISKIDESKNILTQMIDNAKRQHAQNFDMLYNLESALNELELITQSKNSIEISFLQKWDNIMGWVPKVFESHPLLDFIRAIDKEISH